METDEIKASELNAKRFIKEKIAEIAQTVGNAPAITALSGGVDSSVVTVLGRKALGPRLRACFVDNGLMRKGEAKQVVSSFGQLGIFVQVIYAKEEFFDALRGLTDPEEKRRAITTAFYQKVFKRLILESGAKFILQGTILTDIEETVRGVKKQHNVLEQIGIDPQKAFGYRIIEPLQQLRKDDVRKVAKQLGLPESRYNRMPFPGPALAARIHGEVTAERTEIVRKATAIVEKELKDTGAFQCMAILHEDQSTGMRDNKRQLGFQIEIRCWDSVDARTATPTRLPHELLERLAQRITNEVPEVVSVTYNITSKPPSTMEAI